MNKSYLVNLQRQYRHHCKLVSTLTGGYHD